MDCKLEAREINPEPGASESSGGFLFANREGERQTDRPYRQRKNESE